MTLVPGCRMNSSLAQPKAASFSIFGQNRGTFSSFPGDQALSLVLLICSAPTFHLSSDQRGDDSSQGWALAG